MKIIGFIYHDGAAEMVLKGDSCMLNGRKPFFTPEGASEIGVTPCMILRVGRLGKEIMPKFADRYYDAVAPGADFIDLSKAREAQEAGRPWTEALAFDYSLAVGEWTEGVKELRSEGVKEGQVGRSEGVKEGQVGRSEGVKEWLLSPEEAVAEASKVMTIRQGDLIYIQAKQAPRKVEREEIIRVEIDGEEKLYCKIK